ncbi:MAG TPA: C-terminal binding protein [Ktedonobacteraceae bacterium]|nr:C-terminal binding protein [Ktedonobacteraceae bacterium]
MVAFTIAVTDHPFRSAEPERALARELGAELRLGQCKSVEEVKELVRGADAVLTSLAPVSAEVIASLDHCRIIARYGIGVDNVDLAAATRQKIAVTNVPDYATDEVSDHALALLLACARKIVVADRSVHAGSWELATVAPMYRLRGQSLGLIGLGKIARRLAVKAQALGLHVYGTDPYVTDEMLASLDITRVGVEELLHRSDFVSLHAPLTDETLHLMNADTLAMMKPGAFLINTARGALIDEDALAEALASGKIAGAALDVTVSEPLALTSPLRALPSGRLILTPHIAYYSEESLRDLQQQAVDEVKRALRSEPVRALVNRELLV